MNFRQCDKMPHSGQTPKIGGGHPTENEGRGVFLIAAIYFQIINMIGVFSEFVQVVFLF